jgi:hypothetical protein
VLLGRREGIFTGTLATRPKALTEIVAAAADPPSQVDHPSSAQADEDEDELVVVSGI